MTVAPMVMGGARRVLLCRSRSGPTVPLIFIGSGDSGLQHFGRWTGDPFGLRFRDLGMGAVGTGAWSRLTPGK